MVTTGAGESPPVVLVHGFASSSEHNWRRPGWVDIVADTGRPVVTVDLLGHGTAPRPTDPADYAGVEDAVLAAMPPGPVDAVGFSAGAMTLLALARATPDRFRRLALLGVGDNVFEPGDPEPIVAALEGRAGPEDVQGTLFRRLAETAGNDVAPLVAFLRRPREPLDETALGAVTCPVLVVLGERDPIGGAGRLAAALPDARVVTLPGADHFSTFSDFGAIDAVVRFLEAPAVG